MTRERTTAAARFGQRLRELMRARRHTSDTARSGVDVGALADAAGTSYEMARRYAEGMAVPRTDTLQRIAEWLKVAPALLAWGAQEGDSSIDQEVLQRCIAAVMQAQATTRITIEPERAARLVSLLYLEAMDGRTPQPATVARMLKTLA